MSCTTGKIKNQIVPSTHNNPIQITDAARAKIQDLMNGTDAIGIKIGIEKGGCTGMSYKFELLNKNENIDHDQIISFGDFFVVLDPKTLLYIIGTILDYIYTPLSAGFVFQNPNAKGQCGCGESFYV